MTVTDTAPLACPQCGGTNTNLGASGSAICRDCANLWDPNGPTLPAAPVIPPFALPPVDEAFAVDDVPPLVELVGTMAPESEPTPGVDVPVAAVFEQPGDEMIGGGAVLEGGQVATVIAFTGNETVVVRLINGDMEEVSLGDVLRIMPPIEIPEAAVMPDDVDAMPADIQLALTLAKLILRAGVESVTGTGPDVTPGVPPTGYLPTEAELHEVVERAAGLAVAMLVDLFELDVDAILEVAGAVTEDTTENEPAEGADNDARGSGTDR